MKAETALYLFEQLKTQMLNGGGKQAIVLREHNDVHGWYVAELTEVGANDWHESGVGNTPDRALEDLAFKIKVALEEG